MNTKSKPKKQTIEQLEQQVIHAQEAYIKERFGQEAADCANYGWGVDCDALGVSVCTKIYSFGTLQTNAVRGDAPEDFEHEFEES